MRLAPALAADATFTNLGIGVYDSVQGSTEGDPAKTLYYVGVLGIAIDGGALTAAYCVDIHNPISIGDSEPQVAPDYPCEVVYILSNAFPNPSGIPVPLADFNREAAAVQSAIWHFTDGFTITAPADIVSRTAQIVAAAQSQCAEVPAVPQSLDLAPVDATNYLPGDTTHSVTATLLDTNGTPLANYPIDIAVTGASGPQTLHGTTNAQGQLTVDYTNAFAVSGTDSITASAAFTVPLGLKFKREGLQGIVLAGTPQPGTVTATASKHWVPAACGDGVVNQAGERCDDGNQIDGDGCDSNCTPTACGNGVVTEGEQCDDGNLLDGDGCDSNCTPTACGNGIVTVGEQCDDGNRVNGDACDNNCTTPRCGNGVVTGGEHCDDGNQTDGDGCDTNCTPTGCGNGVVTAGEACDDGNTVDGDGCDHDCSTTRCGNGIVTAGEQCDDGNAVSGDGCDANCTPTGCGNGVVTAGEQCDDGNQTNGDSCDTNCMAPACGNGIVDPSEQCDDGNLADGDGCDSNCTVTGCGNGVVTAGEECDDGNITSGDACDANCTLPGCGNGIIDPSEQCDDGNLADGDGCDSNCTFTGCGNHIMTLGEECDDGNAADGDGCEADCTSSRCGNGIVDAGEQCDDGNLVDGDGCSATCRLQEICTDLIDNDGDGAIDCDDTECACEPILKDPAIIKMHEQAPDYLRVHGALEPLTACDPVADGISIVVSNANGVIYKAALLPGDLAKRGNRFKFKDPGAKLGQGSRGGLYALRLSQGRLGRLYRMYITIEAFGDFSAATLPGMTVQIGIGNDMFFNKGDWQHMRSGWQLRF